MTVIVDNTGFNVEYWARFTESEFVQMNIKSGTFGQYNEENRIYLLKEAYRLINEFNPS